MPSAVTIKTRWRLSDILDLEYFLHRDETDTGGPEAAKTLALHDREIYLGHIRPKHPEEKPRPRRFIVKSWLSRRRSEEKAALPPETPLPGEVYEEIYRLLSWIFALLGLLSGAGIASSFLIYRGIEPLNVAYYFGVLILSQFLLMLVLILVLTFRLVNRSFSEHSILYSLISRLLVRLFLWVKKRTVKNLSGNRRSGIEAALGVVRGRRKVYGTLFYWPVFILAQVFGVCFNIGIIAATLIKVVTADIAFGWQSTVQFSPEMVHDLVRSIALPWSWFIPSDIAYPSLAEIEGSRMILKEGIYFLATENLISWWPFLCFAALFYGLIPRALLLIMGMVAKHRALDKQDFEFSDIDRLMHRLQSPMLSTQGSPTSKSAIPEGLKEVQSSVSPTPVQHELPAGETVVALVPDDIFDEVTDDQLKSVVEKVLGFQVREKIRIGAEYESDRTVLERVGRLEWQNGRPHVLLLQEGWQPPIREILHFIQELRNTIGEKGGIEVGLIGKPAPETIFTPVNEDNWNAWIQKLSGLGDPYLRLERLSAE
ncbi:MAG: DUF2868 domain-containing protein [Desulfococcaceae bacterium]